MREETIFMDDNNNEVDKDRATKFMTLIINNDGTIEEIFGNRSE